MRIILETFTSQRLKFRLLLLFSSDVAEGEVAVCSPCWMLMACSHSFIYLLALYFTWCWKVVLCELAPGAKVLDFLQATSNKSAPTVNGLHRYKEWKVKLWFVLVAVLLTVCVVRCWFFQHLYFLLRCESRAVKTSFSLIHSTCVQKVKASSVGLALWWLVSQFFFSLFVFFFFVCLFLFVAPCQPLPPALLSSPAASPH